MVWLKIVVVVVFTFALTAGAYDYTDLWSTPAERDEWRQWIAEQSSAPVTTLFHPVGQIQAFSGSIALAEPFQTGVLQFLNGPFRQQIGVRPDESIQYERTWKGFVPIVYQHNTQARPVEFFSYRVIFGERPELGRQIVAVVSQNRLVGLSNGHVPSIGKYGSSVAEPISKALDAIEAVEGTTVGVVSSELGWITPS